MSTAPPFARPDKPSSALSHVNDPVLTSGAPEAQTIMKVARVVEGSNRVSSLKANPVLDCKEI